jgi:hypothetical protein
VAIREESCPSSHSPKMGTAGYSVPAPSREVRQSPKFPIAHHSSSASIESISSLSDLNCRVRPLSSSHSLVENGRSSADIPRHQRVDTGSSITTIESFDETLASVNSASDNATTHSSNHGLRRRATMTDISCLFTLTNPKVSKMHKSALQALQQSVRALQEFPQNPTRAQWEAADNHFRMAVKTAAHVSLWAQHAWPVKESLLTDHSVYSGEAILPGWYSLSVLGWSHDSRTRRRQVLAEEALRRAELMLTKQMAMLESLWAEVGAVTLVSPKPKRSPKREGRNNERNRRTPQSARSPIKLVIRLGTYS